MKHEPKPATPPAKVEAVSLHTGDHVFKGTYTHGGESKPLEFVFNVEEGGIISSDVNELQNFTLNGVV